MRLGVLCASAIAIGAHADPLQDASAALARLRGVYRIRTLTENAKGCDVEGPNVLDKQVEGMFVIGEGLMFCSTISECRAAAARDHVPQKTTTMDAIVASFVYRFNELHGRKLTGFVDEVRWLDPTMCAMTGSTVSLVADGGVVTFERRSVHLQHPPDKLGCGTAVAHELAAHTPCDQRYVVRGVRIAGDRD